MTQKKVQTAIENLSKPFEMEERIAIYQRLCSVFLTDAPRDETLIAYFSGTDDGYTWFKDFIGDYLRPEFNFTTNEAILDVMDYLFSEAIGNANFGDMMRHFRIENEEMRAARSAFNHYIKYLQGAL